MSNDRDNGGPAFPQQDDASGSPGMTLRDYFAAKAMQGFVSTYPNGCIENPMQDIAFDSYEMADAMLAARGQ
jgi:hypothetical protein